MTLKPALATLAIILACSAAFTGCDKSREEMRPDKDTILTESGLQSRDLREMTSQLAPKLVSIPQITQNPYKVTIVVTGVQNRLEGESTRDMDIFVQKLANNLNAAQDRISFIEDRATIDRMAAQQLGNPDPMENGTRYPGANPSPAIAPQFALYGTFQSLRNEQTTYYLCTFKLTNLTTREIVWTGQWDTRTRNLH